jgi:hypothetical protein
MEGAHSAWLNPPRCAPAPGGNLIEIEPRLRAAHKQATLIMYAVMATLVIYVAVVEWINRTRDVLETEALPEVARFILYGVAISMVFLTQIVRALVLRGIPRELDAALQRLNLASVITGVLAETPALMGLVLFIVWGQYTDFYILLFVSLYLFVRHFPRYGTWEKVGKYTQTGGEL